MRFLKKIDFYILKNFVTTFIFMVMMLCIIIIVFDFSEKLEDFITKKVPYGLLIFSYYPMLLLFLANLLSPICIFLSVILFTSRMAQNSEIVAILSSGVSFYRFLLPYIITAILLGGGSYYLNSFLVPDAVEKRTDFEYTYLKNKSFYTARNIHRKIDSVNYACLYAYNQYDKIGENLLIEQFHDQKLITRLEATSATYNDTTKSWRLGNVKIRKFYPNHQLIRTALTMDTAFNLKPDDIYQRDNYTESLDQTELDEYIKSERIRGSDILADLEMEKQERFAYPFATLILTVIGVSLSSRKTRGGIALQIGLGLILGFIYVFMLVSAKVAFSGIFPLWFGIWFPNIVFSILAIILIRWAPK